MFLILKGKYTKLQCKTIKALIDSLESNIINFDKFTIWIQHNYDCPGNSFVLKTYMEAISNVRE